MLLNMHTNKDFIKVQIYRSNRTFDFFKKEP
jgi:hypothetical protein